MKYHLLLATFVVMRMQGQVPSLADGHIDLGGDGVIEQSNRISDVPLVIPC